MKNHKILANSILFLLITLLSACGGDSDESTNQVEKYSYNIPLQTADGWQTTTLEQVGIDTSTLESAMDLINTGGTYDKVHGVLIIKNDMLAFEEYFPGRNYDEVFSNYSISTLHDLHSVSKSFTSALIGQAIEQGYILSLDQTVFSFFPDLSDLDWSNGKDQITLENLLTMQSGLSWIELTSDSANAESSTYQMLNGEGEDDWVRYTLEQEMESVPGEEFKYSTGVTTVIGEILFRATGMYADEFSELNLFQPLGIQNSLWWRHEDGTIATGFGLNLRPRDMAKFGQLFLNGGSWNGQQVISTDWVTESTTMRAFSPTNQYDYAYQWWGVDFDIQGQNIKSYTALGNGGQSIYVFPSLDMVVVFTQGYYDYLQEPSVDNELLRNYILPAAL